MTQMKNETQFDYMQFDYCKIDERLARLGVKLSGALKELAILQEELAEWRANHPLLQMPADPGPQTTEDVMRMWSEWAATNQQAKPTPEVIEKVRKQMEESSRLSTESLGYIQQGVEAVKTQPAPVMPRPAPGKIGPPPGNRDEKMRKVADVLMENGIALGVLDPRASVLQFVLIEHKNTTDVKELFDETFGVGQYTIEESRNPDARPADLRKRPDLLPKKEAPILFTPVPPGYGLDIVAAAAAVPSTIPPTFDGRTGVTPKVAGAAGKERIPNSGE